jgi:hypothetical protein
MTDALGGKFARWSQRKAAARRGGALPVEQQEEAPARVHPDDGQPSARERPEAAPAAREIANNPDAAPATAEDVPVLPPIEELTFQSDFTVFMAKNVPEAIRRAALRKLWVSDPVLANLDGLCDYNEDHHLTFMAITPDQTSYQVGKGYLDEIEEKLAELDGAPSGQGGEDSATGSESSADLDDGSARETAVSKNDAGVGEDSVAPQQAATAEPEGGTPELGEDALK